jgi:hypothetical protein
MAITTSPTKNQTDAKLGNLDQPGPGPVERAKDVASAVAHTAEDAAAYVGQKAEETTAAVAGGLKSLGNTIRDNTPQGGMVGEASAAVASSLESTGRYLQEEGLEGIAGEVTNLIRRNPIAAVLVGIGIGVLLAKLTTRS